STDATFFLAGSSPRPARAAVKARQAAATEIFESVLRVPWVAVARGVDRRSRLLARLRAVISRIAYFPSMENNWKGRAVCALVIGLAAVLPGCLAATAAAAGAGTGIYLTSRGAEST